MTDFAILRLNQIPCKTASSKNVQRGKQDCGARYLKLFVSSVSFFPKYVNHSTKKKKSLVLQLKGTKQDTKQSIELMIITTIMMVVVIMMRQSVGILKLKQQEMKKNMCKLPEYLFIYKPPFLQVYVTPTPCSFILIISR